MKRGISLIAVLMFMMAATTASIVLYRWIGEENFASGSRLKASEAYQASEAGLDAAYSWLSFKAADVGALLSHYLSTENKLEPVLLNSVLGGQTLNSATKIGERFDVYLLGADTVSRPYKLKILSIGKSRDNSQINQTAIFKVDGLYTLRTSLSTPAPPDKTPTDYNEDFWGNMGTVGFLEVSNAVMTQTAAIKNAGGQALNTVKVGTAAKPGYLVLDGDYYTNSGISIYGDLYSTGTFDLCAGLSDFITGNIYIGKEFHPTITSNRTIKIGGSAYFNGKITPNVDNPSGGCGGSLGGTVQIDSNTTIKDAYEYYINGNSDYRIIFDMKGSLAMDSISYIDLGINNNSTSKFEVQKNVAIKKFNKDNPNLNYYPNKETAKENEFNFWPWFGKESNSTLCLPASTSQSKPANSYTCSSSDCYLYKEDASNFYFKTNSTSKSSSDCKENTYREWGADPMDGTKTDKNYKSKLSEVPDVNSCDTTNAPITFDKTIYEEVQQTNPANWVHRLDKPGNCATYTGSVWDQNSSTNVNYNLTMKLATPGLWLDLGEELQNCWNEAKNNGKLYKDEWLVVYIKDKDSFNANNPITTGKYIIINEISNPSQMLKLPPTSTGVQIMLYLPKGYVDGIIVLGGTPVNYDDYNYFIFSDGNIGQFNTEYEKNERKLHGNVFMNNCSVMNTVKNQGNPSFISEGNTEFVKDLIASKVLQDNPSYAGAKEPSDPTDPPEELPVYDSHIIPIGNRLKVDLESKNISKDKINATSTSNGIESSILVMPRIIFLPKGALNETGTTAKKLSDYYTFLYLNGATIPSPKPEPTCKNSDNPSGTKTPTNPGIYTCTFADTTKISNFYVQISSADAKGPILSLSTNKAVLESGCAEVSINVENGANHSGISYSVGVEHTTGTDWTITPTTAVKSNTAEIQSSKSSELIYNVCLSPSVNSTSGIVVYFTGGGCAVTGSSGGGCTINDEKSSVTISKKETTAYVYRKDKEPDNIIDCPADIGWKLEGGNCKEISDTKGYKNAWECDITGEIELIKPQENSSSYSCDLSGEGNVKRTLDKDGLLYEYSYKLKRYLLYVSKPEGSVVTFTASNPHGGTITEKCEKNCASVILYHGLDYIIDIKGISVKSVEHSANNLTKISGNEYKIKVITSENLLRIEQSDMAICQYSTDYNDICPGISDLKKVNVKKSLATQSDSSCYFFSYIYGEAKIEGGSGVRVNGVRVTEGDTLPPQDVSVIDGGYYVYVPKGVKFEAGGTYANVDLSESCQTIRDCEKENDCGESGGSVSSSSGASSSASSGDGIAGAYSGYDLRSSMVPTDIVPSGISVDNVCFNVSVTVPSSFGENRSTFIISCNANTSTAVEDINFTVGYSGKCYNYEFKGNELNTFSDMRIVINTSAPIGVGETLRASNVCISSSKKIETYYAGSAAITCELLNSTAEPQATQIDCRW